MLRDYRLQQDPVATNDNDQDEAFSSHSSNLSMVAVSVDCSPVSSAHSPAPSELEPEHKPELVVREFVTVSGPFYVKRTHGSQDQVVNLTHGLLDCTRLAESSKAWTGQRLECPQSLQVPVGDPRYYDTRAEPVKSPALLVHQLLDTSINGPRNLFLPLVELTSLVEAIHCVSAPVQSHLESMPNNVVYVRCDVPSYVPFKQNDNQTVLAPVQITVEYFRSPWKMEQWNLRTRWTLIAKSCPWNVAVGSDEKTEFQEAADDSIPAGATHSIAIGPHTKDCTCFDCRPFRCNPCTKAYPRKDSLKRHEK
ncbi:hypothetical protein BGX23_001548, partial [Mortierella sp. AD031]